MEQMERPFDELTSPELRQVRKELTAWLSSRSFRMKDLKDWLKGYNLPALGYEDSPHDWIRRVFPVSEADFNFECIMAERITDLLKKEAPHKETPTDDKLLYNLFYLCANLHCKEKLAEPLAEVFDFFESNEKARTEFFSENKMYNLNAAFREALISNQTDKKYLSFWQNLLKLKQPPYLRGNIFNGFLGILNISENSRPAIDEIGGALKKMSEYLAADNKGHLKFRRLLQQVKEVWGGYADWDETLVNLAIESKWPDWAIVRLDNLVLPLRKSGEEVPHYFIWEIYLPFLRELKIYPEVVREAGILLEIKTSEKMELFLEKTSPTVEHIRLGSPDKNYRSVLGAANEGFMELESYFTFKGENVLATAIKRGRIEILERLGFNGYRKFEVSEVEVTNSLQNLANLLSDFTPRPSVYITSVPRAQSSLYL